MHLEFIQSYFDLDYLYNKLFDLPKHNLVKYLQIRHWIRSQSLESFPNISEKSLFEDRLQEARGRSRVNIRASFQRWRELKERKELESDAEVALFLRDR